MIGASSYDSSLGTPRTESYFFPMVLMVSLYFSIGFITALNDILIPHFKDLFHLTNFLALLVQFCFFGAYFVMSLPSGWIVGRIGYKPGIIAALLTMTAGLLVFIPASIVISYPLFLFALFIVGSGLALLQVAINPYVGALGNPETAASRLNICGLFQLARHHGGSPRRRSAHLHRRGRDHRAARAIPCVRRIWGWPRSRSCWQS